MPLPTFAKKDEIPKGFEDLYEEADGKWAPKEVEDVGGLKKTLDDIKQEKKDAIKAQRKAEDEKAELERKLAAATATAGDKNDTVTKALAKFDADLVAAKDQHTKELAAAHGELRTLKLDDKAKAAFLKAGGRPEKADAALKLHKDSLDLADDGRIVIKDAKGEVTTTTVEDFWGKTFRAEMPEFFTGTKAAGGGGNGGAGRQGQSTGKMTPDEIVANPMRALQEANEVAAS